MKMIESRDDYNAVQQAIASGINSTDVGEALQQLGYAADGLDTVDWSRHGEIEISGGENETACIIILRVERIEMGFSTLRIESPADERVAELENQLGALQDHAAGLESANELLARAAQSGALDITDQLRADAAREVNITLNDVNGLLYRYDNEPEFGVRDFHAALHEYANSRPFTPEELAEIIQPATFTGESREIIITESPIQLRNPDGSWKSNEEVQLEAAAASGRLKAEQPVDPSPTNAYEDAEEALLAAQHPGSCADCGHRSDCALHNGPALPVGPCNCGGRAA